MFKKSLAIILSTALALGILVQGSFAYSVPEEPSTLSALLDTINSDVVKNQLTASAELEHTIIVLKNTFYYNGTSTYQYEYFAYFDMPSGTKVALVGDWLYLSSHETGYYVATFTNGQPIYFTATPAAAYSTVIDGVTYYATMNLQSTANQMCLDFYCSDNFYIYSEEFYHQPNLLLVDDNRFMDVYMTMSTYGKVKYLCIEVDDVILSSSWFSVRYIDIYGNGTEIFDYPFQFFTSNGHTYIQVMPDEISDDEFTVTSVVFSGSSSWGVKELSGLDLTFNEGLFPTPIPSAYPVPDYSYYDTTYINYNGGNPEIIYTPISSRLTIGFLGSDTSKYYFLDEFPFLYLEQPFSYSFIVIPDVQYEYSSFLDDCIYQYDVVIDDFEITNDNYSQTYSFDYIYGSGAWSNLNGLLTAAQVSDVSSILETWYSSHDPIVYQFPYQTNEAFSFDDRVFDCSLILTDTFFFKQTNYLLGDTGDILSEFSERFFKIDGFSDSLFDNISSLYNLNLQYYDSSLDALTGLSYWLNDNDISSNLSDITNLLSSLDNYLSSVDAKLNYLVTIDSDLNDLLEWFQNQEDSDVILTLPDFNPSILIEVYGQNIGDLVGFFQEFVNVLPDFDFSDFPNFFDYAADLVDDVAGQDDDVINDLYQPYDYSDSGLHEFGWD